MNNIYVTKTYLPERKKYDALLDEIWNSRYVTNGGPFAKKLESELSGYLGCENLQWLSNGTIAIQLAIHCLELTGEILTTPFTYVATANSIIWEKCTPVFVDINPKTFAIDMLNLESHLSSKTSAILAVHIYGYPAPVDELDTFAKANNLKLIYDGAHAFGCRYKGKSLMDYGDVTTISFHATKVFHTIEGGAVVMNDKKLASNIKLAATHGHKYEDYLKVGINGKNSEFHAAIGLLNLEIFDEVIAGRKEVFEHYLKQLEQTDIYFLKPELFEDFTYNYAYLPALFPDEKMLLATIKALNEISVFPRRYFFPSLNTLSYLNLNSCPVAEDISKRILCLPLYHDLEFTDVNRIVKTIKQML